MDKHILKAIEAVEALCPAALHVDELEGMYMLYADKEPATGYLSGLTMYHLLLAAITCTAKLKPRERMDAEQIRALYRVGERDGLFGESAGLIAAHPERSLTFALAARSILLEKQAPKTQ